MSPQHYDGLDHLNYGKLREDLNCEGDRGAMEVGDTRGHREERIHLLRRGIDIARGLGRLDADESRDKDTDVTGAKVGLRATHANIRRAIREAGV